METFRRLVLEGDFISLIRRRGSLRLRRWLPGTGERKLLVILIACPMIKSEKLAKSELFAQLFRPGVASALSNELSNFGK